ncbi:SRPBCC domain-containing protein [Brevibacillus sp. AY1]|uniref:SRPBCC family protein n=1 Tax=Brevibacillus sp. AY1 TaxID=2807621 RepID=UPI002455AFE4|nr:SRPBCC domain-containing protein [Brevibacillus sp. AY1]MDH4616522.1 SRPBCC domain-containing protein [Brevibacillus sp. AY1]
MSSFQTEIDIASSKELVWLAWTQSERITKWFAPEAYLEPRLGGAYELYFTPGNHDTMGTKGCIVTLWEPQERLGFTWKGPDDFAAVMNHEGALTYVLVSLSEQEGATKVLVEHFGWGDTEEWEKARAWHQMAWSQVLGSLKKALEAGVGELCCTP